MVQDEDTIRPLSEALRKKAKEEINETPEKITTELQKLKDWITEQPHLHSVRPTNQWLIAFLRGCKYDLEKAKKKIDMYYKFKKTLPEYYGNRDPFDPNIQEILKIGAFLPLRKLSEDSARVCLTRPGPFCSTKLPISEYLKVCLMVMEICLLEDDNFVVGGDNSLVDLEGMGFGFLLSYTPAVAKKSFTCIEGVLSVRLKSILFLHPIFGLTTALTIMKMFLTAKIKNRIHVFDENMKGLYEIIDKSILPKEYGGTDGSLQELIDYWKSKVESYREWFTDENACSDELKRPKKIGWFS